MTVDNHKVIVAPQARLFHRHPRYGWTGAAGVSAVRFIRDDSEYLWTVECDADGYRRLGLPQGPGRKVWLFGCSNTFGYGLPVEETFAYRLQAARPDWAVRNFAVTGYGSGQMLLTLADALKKDRPDEVIFCHLWEHYLRTVAALEWVKGVMTSSGQWFDVAANGWPRVGLTANGGLYVNYVPFANIGVESVDWRVVHSYARPDEWYMIQVEARVLAEAAAAVRAVGGRFSLAHYQPASLVVGRAREMAIPTIDFSAVDKPEFTLRPFDCHPNGKANEYYAARVLEALEAPLA